MTNTISEASAVGFSGCWAVWCRNKTAAPLLSFFSLSNNIALSWRGSWGKLILTWSGPWLLYSSRAFWENTEVQYWTWGWLAKSTAPPVKSTLIFCWAVPRICICQSILWKGEGRERGLETNTATASPAGSDWKDALIDKHQPAFISTDRAVETVQVCD